MIPPGGHGSPFAPFQRTRRSPCFTHTQGRRFPSNCETCSGKPHKVFLCTKCLLLQACYPSFARRWNGTLDTVCCKYAYGTALWRTSFRKHCPSRSSALTAGTDWEGAVLQAEEIPLSLKCSRCGQIFSPARQKRFSAPCPFCGEEQGYSIEVGRELYIQSMEAG